LKMKLTCYGLKECSLEWVESYLVTWQIGYTFIM
jgi:hypothetical protein